MDISGFEGRDPIDDFNTLVDELRHYNDELLSRPALVFANKCDIARESL